MDESVSDIIERMNSNPVSAVPSEDQRAPEPQSAMDRVFMNPVSRVPHRGLSSGEVDAKIEKVIDAESTARRGNEYNPDEFRKHVVPKLKAELPELDPSNLEKPYEQNRKLENSRKSLEGVEETAWNEARRKYIPGASDVKEIRDRQELAAAQQRFAAGQATDQDINIIAEAERLGQLDQEHSLRHSILSIPKIAAEFYAGGQVMKGASALKGLRWLGPTTELNAAARAAQGVIPKAASFTGRAAVQAGLMPSQVIAPAAARAAETGGNFYDLKNLGPAAAYGTLQNIVFNLLPAGNEAAGIKGFIGKTGAGAAKFVGGQQAIDIIAGASGLDTGYGVMGDLMEGKGDKALQRLMVQAVTGGLFSHLHGGNPDELMKKTADSLKESKKAGLPAPEAAEKAALDMQQEFAKQHGLDIDKVKGFMAEMQRPQQTVTQQQAQAIPAQTHGLDVGSGREAQAFADLVSGVEAKLKEQGRPIDKFRAAAQEAFVSGGIEKARQLAEQSLKPTEALGMGPKEAPAKVRTVRNLEAPESPTGPSTPLSPWASEMIGHMYRSAEHIGAVDLIEQRAAEGVSGTTIAREIAPKLKAAGLDPSDAKTVVNAVRSRLGIPRMDEPTAFKAWQEKYRARKSPTIAPEPPKSEATQGPPQGEIAPPAQSGEARTHIASYKEPSKSVSDAVTMLERRGTAPRRMDTWTDEGNANANQANGTAAFIFDRSSWSGEGEARQGIEQLSGGKHPLPYEPSLKKVQFKGNESDPKFKKLKESVDQINSERADEKLMKEYGHKGALNPIELIATESPRQEVRKAEEPRTPGKHEEPLLAAVKWASRKGGLATMADVRDSLEKRGITDREEQDAVIKEARKAGLITMSTIESNRGYSAGDFERIQKAAVREGDDQLAFVAIKQGQPEPAKPAEPAKKTGPIHMTETTAREIMSRVEAGEGDLTPEEKVIFQRRLVDGMSLAEAGELMGVPGQTIKNREQRALKKLNIEGTIDELRALQRGSQRRNVADIEPLTEQEIRRQEIGADLAMKEADLEDLNRTDPHFQRHNSSVEEIADINRQMDKIDRQVAALKAKMEKELSRGPFKKGREAFYDGELKGLRESQRQLNEAARAAHAKALSPERGEEAAPGTSGEVPQPTGEAPVRSSPEGGVPTEQPLPGPAYQGTPGEAPGRNAPSAPAAAAGPPAGNELAGKPKFGAPLTAAERKPALGGGQETEAEQKAPPKPLKVTSLKNAQIDAEDIANGRQPRMATARQTNPETWDKAMEILDKDENASARLVDELEKNDRPATAVERALLLHRKVALTNEYERARGEAVEAMKPHKGTDKTELDQMFKRADDLSDEVGRLNKVAAKSITEAGRSLQFQKAYAAEDFSLASMEADKSLAKKRPLTNEEKAEIYQKKQAIDAAEEKVARSAEKLSIAGKEAQGAPRIEPTTPEARGVFTRILDWFKGIFGGGEVGKPKSATWEFADRLEKSAAKELAEKFGNNVLFSGFDPTVIVPLSKYVAAKIIKTGLTFADFTQIAVQKFGEKIKPHLEDIWKKSEEYVKDSKRSLADLREEFLNDSADANGKKKAWREELLADRKTNQGWGGYLSDMLDKLHINWVISSPVTVAKIAKASLDRLIVAPLEQIAGTIWSHIPGIAKIAGLAPSEGRGLNLSVERQSLAQTFLKGFKDFWDTIKTGKSPLERAFGNRSDLPREWIDYQFSLHDAMKAPAVRNAYTRSFLNRLDHATKNGIDVTDPEVIIRLGSEAYQDALRAKFAQKNWLVDAYNKFVENLRQEDQPAVSRAAGLGLRLLTPVVRIPTNLAFEVGNHIFGVGIGAQRAVRAFVSGLENLKPEQADKIMRNFKKGSLGAAGMLIGYYNPKMFGGYYAGKRDEQDVQAGGMRVPGTKLPGWMGGPDIPSWMMHNPLLETFQFGATIRRAQDKMVDGKKQGFGTGVGDAVLGLEESIPLVKELTETRRMLSHNAKERGAAFGEFAKSLAIPQFVQWIAGRMDTDNSGRPIPRAPENTLEHIETGIPGMRPMVKRRVAR